ncbi:hypothetical protein HRG_012538 [Hirsutella rhossiliensis]
MSSSPIQSRGLIKSLSPTQSARSIESTQQAIGSQSGPQPQLTKPPSLADSPSRTKFPESIKSASLASSAGSPESKELAAPSDLAKPTKPIESMGDSRSRESTEFASSAEFIGSTELTRPTMAAGLTGSSTDFAGLTNSTASRFGWAFGIDEVYATDPVNGLKQVPRDEQARSTEPAGPKMSVFPPGGSPKFTEPMRDSTNCSDCTNSSSSPKVAESVEGSTKSTGSKKSTSSPTKPQGLIESVSLAELVGHDKLKLAEDSTKCPDCTKSARPAESPDSTKSVSSIKASSPTNPSTGASNPTPVSLTSMTESLHSVPSTQAKAAHSPVPTLPGLFRSHPTDSTGLASSTASLSIASHSTRTSGVLPPPHSHSSAPLSASDSLTSSIRRPLPSAFISAFSQTPLSLKTASPSRIISQSAASGATSSLGFSSSSSTFIPPKFSPSPIMDPLLSTDNPKFVDPSQSKALPASSSDSNSTSEGISASLSSSSQPTSFSSAKDFTSTTLDPSSLTAGFGLTASPLPSMSSIHPLKPMSSAIIAPTTKSLLSKTGFEARFTDTPCHECIHSNDPSLSSALLGSTQPSRSPFTHADGHCLDCGIYALKLRAWSFKLDKDSDFDSTSRPFRKALVLDRDPEPTSIGSYQSPASLTNPSALTNRASQTSPTSTLRAANGGSFDADSILVSKPADDSKALKTIPTHLAKISSSLGRSMHILSSATDLFSSPAYSNSETEPLITAVPMRASTKTNKPSLPRPTSSKRGSPVKSSTPNAPLNATVQALAAQSSLPASSNVVAGVVSSSVPDRSADAIMIAALPTGTGRSRIAGYNAVVEDESSSFPTNSEATTTTFQSTGARGTHVTNHSTSSEIESAVPRESTEATTIRISVTGTKAIHLTSSSAFPKVESFSTILSDEGIRATRPTTRFLRTGNPPVLSSSAISTVEPISVSVSEENREPLTTASKIDSLSVPVPTSKLASSSARAVLSLLSPTTSSVTYTSSVRDVPSYSSRDSETVSLHTVDVATQRAENIFSKTLVKTTQTRDSIQASRTKAISHATATADNVSPGPSPVSSQTLETDDLETDTSTATITRTYTITSCAPTVTNCPIGKVATEVIVTHSIIDNSIAVALRTSRKPDKSSQIYRVEKEVIAAADKTDSPVSCAPGMEGCSFGEASVEPDGSTPSSSSTPFESPSIPSFSKETVTATVPRTDTITGFSMSMVTSRVIITTHCPSDVAGAPSSLITSPGSASSELQAKPTAIEDRPLQNPHRLGTTGDSPDSSVHVNKPGSVSSRPSYVHNAPNSLAITPESVIAPLPATPVAVEPLSLANPSITTGIPENVPKISSVSVFSSLPATPVADKDLPGQPFDSSGNISSTTENVPTTSSASGFSPLLPTPVGAKDLLSRPPSRPGYGSDNPPIASGSDFGELAATPTAIENLASGPLLSNAGDMVDTPESPASGSKSVSSPFTTTSMAVKNLPKRPVSRPVKAVDTPRGPAISPIPSVIQLPATPTRATVVLGQPLSRPGVIMTDVPDSLTTSPGSCFSGLCAKPAAIEDISSQHPPRPFNGSNTSHKSADTSVSVCDQLPASPKTAEDPRSRPASRPHPSAISSQPRTERSRPAGAKISPAHMSLRTTMLAQLSTGASAPPTLGTGSPRPSSNASVMVGDKPRVDANPGDNICAGEHCSPPPVIASSATKTRYNTWTLAGFVVVLLL